MDKTLSPEYQSSIQDWLRKALDSVATLPESESAAKALALSLSRRWVEYAQSTQTGVDDFFAQKFHNVIESEFPAWWAFLRKSLGLTPNGEIGGEATFGTAELNDQTELLEVVHDDSASLCTDAGHEFGVSATHVQLVLELVLPILLEWFRKRSQ